MTYQLTVEGLIKLPLENGSTMYLPAEDNGTPEWSQYQAWLDEGNTPLPAPTEELTWDTIRAKRDQLIRDSDWTMIPGATVDQAQWAAYRQILRDLPQTYDNPEDVVWPTQPSTSGPNTTPLE